MIDYIRRIIGSLDAMQGVVNTDMSMKYKDFPSLELNLLHLLPSKYADVKIR